MHAAVLMKKQDNFFTNPSINNQVLVKKSTSKLLKSNINDNEMSSLSNDFSIKFQEENKDDVKKEIFTTHTEYQMDNFNTITKKLKTDVKNNNKRKTMNSLAIKKDPPDYFLTESEKISSERNLIEENMDSSDIFDENENSKKIFLNTTRKQDDAEADESRINKRKSEVCANKIVFVEISTKKDENIVNEIEKVKIENCSTIESENNLNSDININQSKSSNLNGSMIMQKTAEELNGFKIENLCKNNNTICNDSMLLINKIKKTEEPLNDKYERNCQVNSFYENKNQDVLQKNKENSGNMFDDNNDKNINCELSENSNKDFKTKELCISNNLSFSLPNNKSVTSGLTSEESEICSVANNVGNPETNIETDLNYEKENCTKNTNDFMDNSINNSSIWQQENIKLNNIYENESSQVYTQFDNNLKKENNPKEKNEHDDNTLKTRNDQFLNEFHDQQQNKPVQNDNHTNEIIYKQTNYDTREQLLENEDSALHIHHQLQINSPKNALNIGSYYTQTDVLNHYEQQQQQTNLYSSLLEMPQNHLQQLSQHHQNGIMSNYAEVRLYHLTNQENLENLSNVENNLLQQPSHLHLQHIPEQHLQAPHNQHLISNLHNQNTPEIQNTYRQQNLQHSLHYHLHQQQIEAQSQQQQHSQQQQQQQYQRQQHMQHSPLLISTQLHLSKSGTIRHKRVNPLTIDDLIMDEFNEDPNTAYKLNLSPSNARHDNQDDGYETSAGDVLTPNSHSSSTHSITPQHQISHTINLIPPKNGDEQQNQPMQSEQKTSNNDVLHHQHQQQQQQQQQLQLNLPQINENDTQKIPIHVENTGLTNSSYHFMEKNHINSTRSIDVISPRQKSDVDYINSSQNSIINQQKHEFHSTPTLELNTDTNKYTCQQTLINCGEIAIKPPQKRRGRKKKIIDIGNLGVTGIQNFHKNDVTNLIHGSSSATGCLKVKERKKHDRFNGMTEEEVVKRTLPDHLCNSLDIVIIGTNPGLFAAYKGHHYAGPGNHFWKCLYLAGLTQEQMNADEDYKLMKYGIGFTNMVQRPTKGSADLTRKEIKDGSRILLEKLQRFRPKVAVFNGKLIYEVFSGKKDFNFGHQPECVEGTETHIWVMPSSSARCAQLPRAADKVPFYAALKKFRDYLNGLIPHIDESECIFTEQRIKQFCDQENLKSISSVNNNALEFSIDVNNLNNTIRQEDELQQLSQRRDDYIFRSDENQQSVSIAGLAPGEGPPNIITCNSILPHENNYLTSFQEQQSLPGKKKRGRPKKIKSLDIIDPVTGNKIELSNLTNVNNSYNNILNLSVINEGNGEIAAKKKRGRPKKIKTNPDQILHQINQTKTNILQTTQSSEHNNSLHQKISYSSENLASNPHLRIYSSVSPMHSPSVNCSYRTETPPVNINSHLTPPLLSRCDSTLNDNQQQTSSDLKTQRFSSVDTCSGNGYYPNKIISSSAGNINSEVVPCTVTHTTELQTKVENHSNEQHHQNSSPNICGVDFGSQNVESNTNSNDQGDHESFNNRQSLSHQHILNHNIINYENIPNNEVRAERQTIHNFSQWLSPTHQEISHLSSLQYSHQRQQQEARYREEQNLHSLQLHPNEINNQSSLPGHWEAARHQQYDENSHYITSRYPNSQIRMQQSQASTNVGQANHEQIQQSLQSQSTQERISSDLANKSLSGLESLIDQIPAISENESQMTSTSAVHGTHSENRLRNFPSHNIQQRAFSKSIGGGGGILEEESENFEASSLNSNLPNADMADTVVSHRSGNNTPINGNSTYTANSPNNYSIHRLSSTSATSSPVLMSPHQQQKSQQYSDSTTPRLINEVLSENSHNVSTSSEKVNNSSESIEEHSIAPSSSSSSHIYSGNSSSNNISNFSISNLATSSAIVNDIYASPNPPNSNNMSYHHNNLIAAAALAVAASSPPSQSAPTHVTHPQMYMDPHSHIAHHVPVNSMYSPHHAVHHHHHHHHPGFGSASSQHTSASDYTFGAANVATGLHMLPSPSYPYSYGTPAQMHPPPGFHSHPHSTHPLSIFERLKSSDISGYGGF